MNRCCLVHLDSLEQKCCKGSEGMILTFFIMLQPLTCKLWLLIFIWGLCGLKRKIIYISVLFIACSSKNLKRHTVDFTCRSKSFSPCCRNNRLFLENSDFVLETFSQISGTTPMNWCISDIIKETGYFDFTYDGKSFFSRHFVLKCHNNLLDGLPLKFIQTHDES